MENNIKDGLKWGIILGLINILLGVIIYVLGADWLMSNMFRPLIVLALLFITNVVILVISGISFRKSVGGFVEFKKVFLTLFVTSVIGLFIAFIFNQALYNWIDPDYVISYKQLSIEKIYEYEDTIVQSQGQVEFDKMIDKMENEDSFGFISQLRSTSISIIVYVIISLIIAASIKKEEPIF